MQAQDVSRFKTLNDSAYQTTSEYQTGNKCQKDAILFMDMVADTHPYYVKEERRAEWFAKKQALLEKCKNMLRAKLAEIKEREHLEKISDIKGVQMKIEWGSQIRSYVFMPYQLVKDHRTDYEDGNIDNVMNGDLDGFINAYLSMKASE